MAMYLEALIVLVSYLDKECKARVEDQLKMILVVILLDTSHQDRVI